MDLAAIFTGTASVGAYIAIGIPTMIVLGAISGLFFGMKRGFMSSVLRLILVACAAMATYFVMILSYKYIDAFFAGKTLTEVIMIIFPQYGVIAPEQIRNIVASFDAATAERIIMLIVALVVVPTVFVGVFYLMKAVSYILYWIFDRILGFKKKKKNKLSKLLGALVGVVQGALIAVIAILPVVGFVGLAADAREELTSKDRPEETVVMVETFYATYLDDSINSPIVATIRKCGGDIIFNKLIGVTVEGETIDMRKEATTLAGLTLDAMPLTKDFDFMKPNDAQKAALNAILDGMGEDKYTLSIVSGVLRGASKAMVDGTIPLELEEPFKSFAIQFINTFTTSNEENVGDDLKTLLEVYIILADNDILLSFSGESELDPTDLLVVKDDEGKTVISNVISALDENERTQPIVTALTKFSLELMIQNFPAIPSIDGVTEEVDVEVVYEDVKTGVNELIDIVNNDDPLKDNETKKSEVKESLDQTLKDNNIALDDEVLDGISDYVMENFVGMEELTPDNFNQTLLSFYDAYLNSQAGNGDVGSEPGGEVGGNPDGEVTPE